jgi:hypothetical protein
MSDDLISFLRARLNEDERVARAAKPGPWRADGGSVYATHPTDEVVDYTESAGHIARHDPARVLHEVEAKRRIIEEHRQEMLGWCETCDVPGDAKGSEIGCPTVRFLALPYADHPDYRQDWTP